MTESRRRNRWNVVHVAITEVSQKWLMENAELIPHA